MSEFTWRNISLLPANQGTGWGIYKSGVYQEVTADDAKQRVLKWLPGLPVLFGAPGTPNLLPPTEILQLRKKAMLALRKHYINATTATVGCALPFLAIYFLHPHSASIYFGLALLSLWCVVSFDYLYILRHHQSVTERALFYYWLRTNPNVRWAALYSTVFMVTLGATQLLLQGGSGNSIAFDRLGAMYKSLEQGQYWRLLTGPYLHYTLIHFMSNLFQLVIMAAAAAGIIGRRAIFIFILGNLLAGWAQWVFGPQLLGSFGGVSGGVYALYGVLIGAGIKYRDLFPRGLLTYFVAVGILGVLSTDLVSKTAASIAHYTGFSFGLVCGFVIRLSPRIFADS
ncbi:membrane associated rhomboid family serine protease [Pseudomonas sp. TE3786]